MNITNSPSNVFTDRCLAHTGKNKPGKKAVGAAVTRSFSAITSIGRTETLNYDHLLPPSVD